VLSLLRSGNLLRLADSSLLTTLYGKLEGDQSKWLAFAAVSEDGGFTWYYRSTIADGDDASETSEGPNALGKSSLGPSVLRAVAHSPR
tara:strand:+ start:290 stop:553 length:264 start_codon:yes stop_codon:yes gene_type:complete